MPAAVRVDFPSAGLRLEGRFRPGAAEPDGQSAGVVICHPHPLFGGSMDNNVVEALEESCQARGLSTLAFNFRGAGASEGAYDNMRGEVEDVIAALVALAARPGVEASRLGLAGYSFGGLMALYAAARVRSGQARLTPGNGSGLELKALALVSPMPPAGGWERDRALKPLLDRPLPTLIASGTADRFCPLTTMKSLNLALGMDSRLIVVEGADHFFGGMEPEAAVPAAELLAAVLVRPSGPGA